MNLNDVTSSIGYVIGYHWPLVVLCVAIFANRESVSNLIDAITKAIQTFSAVRKTAKANSIDAVTAKVFPAFVSDVQWDRYEAPAYLRKQKVLSF